MHIRLATPDDIPAINAIFNYYVRYSTATYNTEPTSDPDRATWLAQHTTAHPAIVMEGSLPRRPIPGRPELAPQPILGWASLSPFRPHHAYHLTVEDSIYLHPDHHRQGLGRILLQELIARGRTLHHRTIVAVIDGEQTPSIALHEALGFVQAGVLKQVGRKFDRWLDVVYMQLLL